jgi:hypothetical protein
VHRRRIGGVRARHRIGLGLAALAAGAAAIPAPAVSGGVAGPTALVASGASVWVADTSGTVRRLDAHTGALAASTRVPGYPSSLAADRRSIWVATVQPGVIVRISRRTNRRVGPPIDPGGGAPVRLAVGGNTLWVVNEGDDRIWRVDAHSNRTIGSTVVSPAPWLSATVAADARGAWVAYSTADRSSTLVRLDAGGHIAARRTIAEPDVGTLAIRADTLLALAGTPPALLRLRWTSGTAQAPAIAVDRDPTGLALDGDRAWVSSLGPAHGLRELDLASGRTIAGPRRAPGRAGRADDIALAGGVLWATNAYGIVSRLDPRTGARRGRPLRVP